MRSYVKAANKKKKASYAEVAVNNYGRIESNNYREYEKNKKAYDLAMRIAAEDAAFSSDAQKVGNITKAYGGVYTGSQDPMHIMLGNHMGAFASSGAAGAADRAYDNIIKDAEQMADNGEIHKEDAEKIIRKAKYNRYYSGIYPESVKKAGKEQAEYIKDLGISNKEYPWYVKYKDLSSGALKAAAEAAERARNGEKTIKAGSKEIDITKMADATDDEIEWLKNRSAAVLERERYERYGKMDYHALKEAAAHTWDPEEKEWILSYA
ncbi:MAG: hypothetical protein IKN47_06470, partial [Lachnospiraceae bacterium]|nr:hypothetical protein [Lachnospiraceae bacterium]